MASTFPDPDFCPAICKDIGAFVKSDKSPTVILRDQKDAMIEEATKAKEAAAIKEKTELAQNEEPVFGPDSSTESQPAEKHLPQLMPGPDGKVDWTPLAGLTGSRPSVSKYSLSRYSLEEWKNYNATILDPEVLNNANILEYNGKSSMMKAFGGVDKTQDENNKRLKQKAKDLFRWKVEVERACRSITNEVETLERERQRLKAASRVLMLPESISKECLELRSNRGLNDLVSDLTEQELIKEMQLVKEVRATLKKTLEEIEEQQIINKAAKHRCEYDWCDKTTAYNTDCINISLDIKSKLILFRPGATRFGEFSAPLEYWDYFCRQNIMETEAARQKSTDLRSSLEAILIGGGRKLRTQADKTDVAIAETIAITSELLTKLEKTLVDTLQKLANTETLIESLLDAIRKMDAAMKLAQTRLDNRNNFRQHGESVRDQPHIGLINEVQAIHQTVTSLVIELNNARKSKGELMEKRIVLEKDIASKRKSLIIDRERIGTIRSYYPSASELAGF